MTTSDGSGRFAGKVAFVTGAGGGIGRATALAFAQEGARVAVADLSEQAVRETARLIAEAGGRAPALTPDVCRSEDVKAALDRTVEEFGGLDVAFNNAGVEQRGAKPADVDEAEWDRVLAVNLRGVFLSMKHEIPLLLRRGGGAVVNTSSGAGVRAFGGGGPPSSRSAGGVGPREIAATVLWLCSDAASFVTGHAMVADGGQTV